MEILEILKILETQAPWVFVGCVITYWFCMKTFVKDIKDRVLKLETEVKEKDDKYERLLLELRK